MFFSGDVHVAFESMVLAFENYAYLHFTLMLYWCPGPYQTQSNDWLLLHPAAVAMLRPLGKLSRVKGYISMSLQQRKQYLSIHSLASLFGTLVQLLINTNI